MTIPQLVKRSLPESGEPDSKSREPIGEFDIRFRRKEDLAGAQRQELEKSQGHPVPEGRRHRSHPSLLRQRRRRFGILPEKGRNQLRITPARQN
jgi:hypothetical protein